jgi:hypothetical protein
MENIKHSCTGCLSRKQLLALSSSSWLEGRCNEILQLRQRPTTQSKWHGSQPIRRGLTSRPVHVSSPVLQSPAIRSHRDALMFLSQSWASTEADACLFIMCSVDTVVKWYRIALTVYACHLQSCAGSEDFLLKYFVWYLYFCAESKVRLIYINSWHILVIQFA